MFITAMFIVDFLINNFSIAVTLGRILSNKLLVNTVFVTASCMADPRAPTNGVITNVFYNMVAIVVHR